MASACPAASDVPLAAKVAFLGSAAAYGDGGPVECTETHMSWVFLTRNEVHKLKKPVRFPYLDFSSLERRHAACVAELELNRRLAPDVYLAVRPLTTSAAGLAIGGAGTIVDWLVVMRRLAEDRTLEHLLRRRLIASRDLKPLVDVLARFYRRARPVGLAAADHIAGWRRNLADNRHVLLMPRVGLPGALVRHVDRRQSAFLRRRTKLLTERLQRRRIVDGHGDLRPEHIWPLPPVRIIDCLEFNPRLRAVDPLDELAFLHVECARLGAEAHGAYLVREVTRALPGSFVPELFAFYRCYRATLRARLAIAHLLEDRPRSPEKWPRLALTYLRAARQAADELPDA